MLCVSVDVASVTGVSYKSRRGCEVCWDASVKYDRRKDRVAGDMKVE